MRKLKFCVLIFYLLIPQLFIFNVNAAESKVLHFSSSVGMPFTNEENTGFEDKLVKAIFEPLGYKVTINFVPAQRALINLNDGIDDGAIGRTKGSIAKFPNIIMIPEKAFDRDFVIFTRFTNFSPSGWESLKPYNVGIIRGWKILENNIKKSRSLISVKDGEALFKLLISNRVDLVIYNRWGGLQKIKEMGLKGINLLEPPIVSAPHYFILNKKYSNLLKPAARRLQEMKKDGTYKAIFNETLGKLGSYEKK